MQRRSLSLGISLLTVVLLVGTVVLSMASAPRDAESQGHWYRGNLHTHSLWSDGDDYPEMIVAWFKDHGYHFLALTDHNVLSRGQRWIDAEKSRGGREALARYQGRYGSDWVAQKVVDGTQMVRLKPLGEFRHLFEEPGKFLMIEGEEITDRFEDSSGASYPVHLNASNLRDLVPPQHGTSVTETIQRNVDAVHKQQQRTGRPMVVHLNHPNYGWAVTAEDLLPIKGGRFFEVYNGVGGTNNYGDAKRAGTERMWDIILARRITERDGEPLYGVATDDSHNYHATGPNLANPGRGWIMVRARQLTPEAIVGAMHRGDFYASTGVRLADVRYDGKQLQIEIDAEPDVRYHTEFIGTRKDFDPASEPVIGEDGQELHATRRYSADIGAVLAESDSLTPSYALRGDELYVRARITSSKPQANPFVQNDRARAWTQPVFVGRQHDERLR